jgi:uncharacterized coiled-coil DUF342 family protein
MFDSKSGKHPLWGKVNRVKRELADPTLVEARRAATELHDRMIAAKQAEIDGLAQRRDEVRQEHEELRSAIHRDKEWHDQILASIASLKKRLAA